jgi:hypothetical protein
MRTLLGLVLGLVVRLWVWTLRVVVETAPGLDLTDGAPLVLAFWHGEQMLLLGWPRRRRTLVMVSWSRDGALQSGVMRAQGLRVVRGSSSRGGAAALRRLSRALSAPLDAAFAVDGPRGPRRRAKPGAALAARLCHGRLVPMGAAVSASHVLGRTWDRFRIPLPFSRVQVVLGAPVDPALAAERPELVDHGIEQACRRAGDLLGGRAAPVEVGV